MNNGADLRENKQNGGSGAPEHDQQAAPVSRNPWEEHRMPGAEAKDTFRIPAVGWDWPQVNESVPKNDLLYESPHQPVS